MQIHTNIHICTTTTMWIESTRLFVNIIKKIKKMFSDLNMKASSLYSRVIFVGKYRSEYNYNIISGANAASPA